MINFEHVEEHSRIYAFLMNYMRFAHHYIFYDEVDILGIENIPKKGIPCLTISNHQNGLMDPLAKLNMFQDRRQPVFIARGDIFKRDFVAKLLKFTKILPTYRTRDGDRSDIRKNNDTFHLAGNILNKGGTVIMYPEAQHQHGRYLGPFKKGFPRICFSAVEQSDFNINLQVLPVCLHYSHYERIKSKLMIMIGKPFTFEEFYDLYQTDPNLAYAQLNEKARASLKEMVIDIEDQENYAEYDFLRTMIVKERVDVDQDFHVIFNEEKSIITEIDLLKNEAPDQFSELMNKTRTYRTGLSNLGLRDAMINKKITWKKNIFHDLLLLCLLPIYILSLLLNGLPYYAPEILVKKLKDRQLISSIRFGLGFLIFPIWYLIMFLLVGILSGSFLLGVWILVFASASIGLLYYYKVWCLKVFHSYRYLLMSKNSELSELKHLKKQILKYFER
ncbi:MAG: 1-acyl-sn-glycerol-3-phosphate acyltransferase [Bacteroidales bacterium]|nr:1-acyl-sn-glycerol-3-phosphate acyltransferase [Bacteroidales bacterium]